MILITGASGHIGKRMAQRFLKQGIDFIGIDYVDNPELPENRFKKLDIRDSGIAELIETSCIDSIIHLAFCTKPKLDHKIKNDIDLNGSRNIAACAVEKGVKNIVFASSGRVYGDQSGEGGIHDSEGHYLNPLDDMYARNKIEAENIFLKAAREHALKVAILRLAIVCWKGGGVGMGDMFKAASKTGRFVSFGNNNPPVQLVHVEDVIDAFFNAIGKEGIFDIASEGTMPLVEIFKEAAKRGGQKPSQAKLPLLPVLWLVWVMWKLGLSPVPPWFVKMTGYDITRDLSETVRVLGRPKFTIDQILDEIVQG